MNLPRRIIPVIAVCIATLAVQGCISVRIKRPIKNAVAKSKQPPMMATKDELAAYLHEAHPQAPHSARPELPR